MRSSPNGALSGPGFRWVICDPAPREHLHAFEGIPPLLVQLLWNRGIKAPDEILAFTRGADAPLFPPQLMRGMAEAIDRLLQARDNGEVVAIYGDYDVDGVTSLAMLSLCFGEVGISTGRFVPRRDVEGYGLNAEALRRLRDEGTSLVVAVDCGISGHREIDLACTMGLDVIVADHHHAPPVLPRAVAVINPRQPGCPYPFKELSAVGIAYKLCQALLERLGRGTDAADQWLDLVALGTVADVVPLQGENRVLVLRGLPRLNPPRRVGLRALAREAGLGDGKIDARAIAFILAPRLNAAGRLADAETSARLLLTSSEVEAASLAKVVSDTNQQRQRLTDDALARARETIRARGELPKLLLIAGQDYPSGVVGLVAARLVEEYWRPAFVAEVGDELTRGSARSIEGFHVAEALARCSEILTRHGGHARAAGFTVPTRDLEELSRRLLAIAAVEISDDDVEPRLIVDAELRLRKHDESLYRTIQQLEPFGSGNPQPLFLSRGLKVVSARIVGRERPGHLKLTLKDASTTWDAIGFGMGHRLAGLGEYLDVVYTVERHEWNGQSSMRLRIKDLRSTVA